MLLDRRGVLVLVFMGVGLACSTPSNNVGDASVAETSQPRNDADEIPCGPRLVLQTVCQQCHTRPMKSGAPFPLVNRTDVLSKTSGAVVRELMIQELEAGRMPLRPATIDAESKATLLAWLKQGAPAVPAQTCVASVEAGLDGAGGDGGTDGGADVQAGDAADDASDGASVD